MPTTPENSWQFLCAELVENPNPELVADLPWVAAPMLTLPPLTSDQELPVSKPVWVVRVAAPDMKFEDKRFASFDRCSSVPNGLFITRLAEQGYYFDQRLGKILCFCCGRERESGHTHTCQPARNELNIPFLHQALHLHQRMCTTTVSRTQRRRAPNGCLSKGSRGL